MRNHKTTLLSALGMTVLLTGCVAPPQPLYQWESYQTQVYDYFKDGSKEKQIAALEQDLEKMRAKGHVAPPGVHAHLGMLYVEAGNDSKGIQELTAEKAQYPESTAYVDFLLKKYQKQ
jgi:hypothetical protein